MKMKTDWGAFLVGLLVGLLLLAGFAVVRDNTTKATSSFCLTVDDTQVEVKADEVDVTATGCIVFKQDGRAKSGYCAPMTAFVFRKGECK